MVALSDVKEVSVLQGRWEMQRSHDVECENSNVQWEAGDVHDGIGDVLGVERSFTGEASVGLKGSLRGRGQGGLCSAYSS